MLKRWMLKQVQHDNFVSERQCHSELVSVVTICHSELVSVVTICHSELVSESQD